MPWWGNLDPKIGTVSHRKNKAGSGEGITYEKQCLYGSVHPKLAPSADTEYLFDQFHCNDRSTREGGKHATMER
jgi:hypothetical protein